MPKPGEHKTVQARILQYASEIGWTIVPRAVAEKRRGFDPDGLTPEDRARPATPFFGDLLYKQVRAFNPKYKEAEGALVGELRQLKADIYGNRDFLTYFRNQGKFYSAEEKRELDLAVVDYGDASRPPETHVFSSPFPALLDSNLVPSKWVAKSSRRGSAVLKTQVSFGRLI